MENVSRLVWSADLGGESKYKSLPLYTLHHYTYCQILPHTANEWVLKREDSQKKGLQKCWEERGIYQQPKKQLKVQYIGIFEEMDSFYWPKMHFLKKGQKIRAWVNPPLIRAMAERKRFFSIDVFPYFQYILTLSDSFPS